MRKYGGMTAIVNGGKSGNPETRRPIGGGVKGLVRVGENLDDGDSQRDGGDQHCYKLERLIAQGGVQLGAQVRDLDVGLGKSSVHFRKSGVHFRADLSELGFHFLPDLSELGLHFLAELRELVVRLRESRTELLTDEVLQALLGSLSGNFQLGCQHFRLALRKPGVSQILDGLALFSDRHGRIVGRAHELAQGALT